MDISVDLSVILLGNVQNVLRLCQRQSLDVVTNNKFRALLTRQKFFVEPNVRNSSNVATNARILVEMFHAFKNVLFSARKSFHVGTKS